MLLVRFPRLGIKRDLIISVLILPGGAVLEEDSNRALRIVMLEDHPSGAFLAVDKVAHLSPTLASSNKSADFSAFQKTSISMFLRLARDSLPASSRSRPGMGRSGYVAASSDISMSLALVRISEDSLVKKRA